MKIFQLIEKLFEKLLSNQSKHKIEQGILVIAIFSYIAHLIIIFINNRGIIHVNEKFFNDPIAAIYTPFSFILIYEVYLLIYFLPKSITIYIGKQYEIITLIVIRRIFKDIAHVDLSADWFNDKYDIQFTFDVMTSLVLFFLILQFYRNIEKRSHQSIKKHDNIKRFVLLKKSLAVILVPSLLLLAFYAFINWGKAALADYHNGILAFEKLNNVFFDDFFTLLIIVDVLLLLFSFFYSDKFYKIIRNSGFVISTILIKISLTSALLVSNALIIGAVGFGYLVLVIHNQYEKNEVPDND